MSKEKAPEQKLEDFLKDRPAIIEKDLKDGQSYGAKKILEQASSAFSSDKTVQEQFKKYLENEPSRVGMGMVDAVIKSIAGFSGDFKNIRDDIKKQNPKISSAELVHTIIGHPDVPKDIKQSLAKSLSSATIYINNAKKIYTLDNAKDPKSPLGGLMKDALVSKMVEMIALPQQLQGKKPEFDEAMNSMKSRINAKTLGVSDAVLTFAISTGLVNKPPAEIAKAFYDIFSSTAKSLMDLTKLQNPKVQDLFLHKTVDILESTISPDHHIQVIMNTAVSGNVFDKTSKNAKLEAIMVIHDNLTRSQIPIQELADPKFRKEISKDISSTISKGKVNQKKLDAVLKPYKRAIKELTKNYKTTDTNAHNNPDPKSIDFSKPPINLKTTLGKMKENLKQSTKNLTKGVMRIVDKVSGKSPPKSR